MSLVSGSQQKTQPDEQSYHAGLIPSAPGTAGMTPSAGSHDECWVVDGAEKVKNETNSKIQTVSLCS